MREYDQKYTRNITLKVKKARKFQEKTWTHSWHRATQQWPNSSLRAQRLEELSHLQWNGGVTHLENQKGTLDESSKIKEHVKK